MLSAQLRPYEILTPVSKSSYVVEIAGLEGMHFITRWNLGKGGDPLPWSLICNR